MKFYEFGDSNNPVIILLPGTCCHWKANFEKVIPLLAEDLRMGLLAQRRNIHISHAILGSSDLDQKDGFSAKFKAWLIGKIFYGMLQKGRLPGFMKRWLEKKPADERLYYEKMLDLFGMNNTRMSFVERESIRN